MDGVVALTHKTGCGMTEGEPLRVLRRVLAGFARHPNFSHVIAIGLGCEVNQLGGLLEEQRLVGRSCASPNIQESGGTRKTVEAGIAFVKEVLAEANTATRTAVPVSELKVALQCGGSDVYSGITANPALGAASDLVVRHGGTVILSESPETYGAEHLLTRRAVSPEVWPEDVDVMHWWEEYTAREGGDERQPLARQQGGLTTIRKSRSAPWPRRGRRIWWMWCAMPRRCGSAASSSWTRRATTPWARQARCGRRQPHVLHHGARQRVRLQARALAQAGDEHGHVRPYGGGYGHQLRDGAGRERERFRMRCADFPAYARDRQGAPTKSEALGFGDAEFAPWVLGATM